MRCWSAAGAGSEREASLPTCIWKKVWRCGDAGASGWCAIALPEPRLIRANQEWAMDFIVDGLANGRMVRILSVIDAFTRECLALEADTSLGSGRVTRALDRLIEERGLPESVAIGQRPGVHLAADVGLGRGTEDRPGAHPARAAPCRTATWKASTAA